MSLFCFNILNFSIHYEKVKNRQHVWNLINHPVVDWWMIPFLSSTSTQEFIIYSLFCYFFISSSSLSQTSLANFFKYPFRGLSSSINNAQYLVQKSIFVDLMLQKLLLYHGQQLPRSNYFIFV